LADMVSFGVAPGMILYALAGQCFAPSGFCINMYIPLLVPVFSAIRLANFNIDTRQSNSFIGVPTPANAIFIASFPLIMQHDNFGVSALLNNHYFLLFFPVVSAYMLIAEIPLLALKFKSFGWKGNAFRWILICSSIVSVAVFQYLGVAIAILLYILISIIHNLTQKNTNEV
jgi:CDP-diacylglycerol---serine O-phosphatidyltransferase